jgi:hypothetical protein
MLLLTGNLLCQTVMPGINDITHLTGIQVFGLGFLAGNLNLRPLTVQLGAVFLAVNAEIDI